jgi:hypothetical protein
VGILLRGHGHFELSEELVSTEQLQFRSPPSIYQRGLCFKNVRGNAGKWESVVNSHIQHFEFASTE